MKKEITITALCVALAVLSGCSGTESQAPSNNNDIATQNQALFGETGGLPYGSQEAAFITESAPANGAYFGRAVAVGHVNPNASVDIVTSTGSMTTHGKVIVAWDNNSSQSIFEISPKGKDDFGAAIAVGKFCPNLTNDDIIIASAPSYSTYKGAFGFIYKDSTRYRVAKKIIYGGENREIAGGAFAIGDLDGDSKNDIVFRSSPIDENDNWEKTKVNVMLDICNSGNEMVIADSVKAESEDFMLGSSIYIADLDGTGNNEIVVVDNMYRTSDNTDYSPNGAIFFYKFSGGKLAQSRAPIIGELGAKSGASIESVAFSDINGDGKLDLIVGEPMWNEVAKREGRVRTYTNLGASAGFDAASLWTVTSGRSNARFGSSVTIADLNNDGVDDLIVGAPGYRADGTDKAQGDVYIYMGTKDGTIFSKEAFWNYNSNVSTSLNDDFGRSVAVTNMDSAGWQDLIVAAPNYSPDKDNLDQGRISIFKEADNFCYAASRCLIDKVCYESGDLLDGNKCQFCDPSQHNFEWSEVSCTGAETECQSAATCDAATGCTMTNKPDGTTCGSPSCDKDSNYITNACVSGVCKATTTSCNGFGCDASTGCETGCSSDSDCQNGYSCKSGKCVNLPPVISLTANYTVMLGETITIKPTVTDPEGDKLTFNWTITPTTNVTATYIDTLNPRVHAGNNAVSGDKMTLTLDVTDAAGNTVTAKTTVTVKGIDLVMTAPTNGAALDAYNVVFSGTTSLGAGKGSIIVSDGDDNTLCTATIQANGTWSCSYTYDTPGNQGAYAYWSRNSKERTDEIIFSFTDPKSSLSITSPTNGQKLTDTNVTIAGKIDSYITYINGTVLVDSTNGTQICKATISYNSWSCTTTLVPGSYQIVAYKDDNVALKSSVVNFTVEDPASLNNPPVIVVNKSFNVEPGGSVRLNASKSYDPDGDPITFSWTGADVSRLSNATSKYPMFYAPDDAVPGTEYHVTVTATDDKKASASTNITIYVISPNYKIDIESPNEGEIIHTDTFTVSGTTDMPNGQKINVVNVGTGSAICTAEVLNKAWSCETSLTPDKYTIVATWAGDSNIASTPVNFEVASSIPENQQPVIILKDTYEAKPLDVFVLDASQTYDPDGDSITFEWSGDYINLLSGTNDSSPIISIPDSVKEGDKLIYKLTVTDDKGASASADTTVVIVKKDDNYFVEITDPAQNVAASVQRSNPVTISGNATPDTDIVVLDTTTSNIICEANSDPIDGAWNCTETLSMGDYAVQAFALLNGVEVAHSGISKFTVLDSMTITTPVIVSPANGEVTSIRPTASGTVNADEGRVYVWIVDGDVSTLFCEAEIIDKTWICTVGYNLENSTEYTIRASWSNGVDQSSTMSDPVTFVTQDADVAQISIISPADGSVLSSDYPVIITGTANPNTTVDVYVDGVLVCTTTTNENKYWACENLSFDQGLHEVYADDADDDKIIPSTSVFFTIKWTNNNWQDEYNNASGGSCSISTPSNANHFGWLFLIAGFAGLGIVRRRKA